jgi:type I restriction enzyme M protein
VITGELKGKVDRVWDAFWSGGISNPLEVIEQITYLLFIRRLDDLQTAKENRANATGRPVQDPIFPAGNTASGVPYSHLRWKYLKDQAPPTAFDLVAHHVFPFLRKLDGTDSTYAGHMKDARLTIPTPGLLVKVMGLLEDVPMDKRDTSGDLYEYILGKIASAGQSGQFRTPRHIIELMVHLMDPKPTDEICDPACGTAGFLTAASEYVRAQYPDVMRDAVQRTHFHSTMFHGYDFDNTMLRIGSMNMLMHGVERPDIRYRDSLSHSAGDDAGNYSLILTNPPFAGSVDVDLIATDLVKTVKTKKTELLFLALFLRLLRPGGRAAVIVPDGVLFGSSTAHKALRRTLVEDHKLDAVIKLPAGAFKPYAGVSTAILCFTKTGTGGTDDVWFYDIQADGWSLDDKRQPLLPEGQLGVHPAEAFVVANHGKNNLPDVLDRWAQRTASEKSRTRTEQSFLVPKAELAANDYDLALNRYREIVHKLGHGAEDASLTLGDVAHLKNDRVARTEMQIITHKNLTDTGINLDVDESGRDSHRKRIGVVPLEEGDILCRTIGAPRWVLVTSGDLSRPLAADQSVHVVRPKEMDSATLVALLRSEWTDQQVSALQYQGPGMPRLSAASLLRIALPPLPTMAVSRRDIDAVLRLRQAMDALHQKLNRRMSQAFATGNGDAGVHEYSDVAAEATAATAMINTWGSPLAAARATFPYPLAQTLRGLEIARALGDARAENEAALQVVESALVILGAISGSYLLDIGEKVPGKWRQRVRGMGVSLGDWLTLASSGLSVAHNKGESLSGVAEILKPEGTLDRLFKDLLAWRNDRAHGSGPRTRSDFIASNSELRAKIESLLAELQPIRRLEWWIADDLDWNATSQMFEIRARSATGDHPEFIPEVKHSETPVSKGEVNVTSHGHQFSLAPMLRILPCTTCGADEFFYPDKLVDGKLLYRSVERGHKSLVDFTKVPNLLRNAIDIDPSL